MDNSISSFLHCNRSTCNIMVVVDATMGLMSHVSQPHMDTMNNLLLLSLTKLQKDDSLTLFGILESLHHSAISKTSESSDTFIGANTTTLEKNIQLTLDSFQKRTAQVKEQCETQGVHFRILVKPGPLAKNKAILEEIVGLGITSIFLDQSMGKHQSFLSKSLSSNSSATHKDGMTTHTSSPQVLNATLRSPSSALTACEDVIAMLKQMSPVTENGKPRRSISKYECGRDLASYGSSAPMSPRSSVSHNTCFLDNSIVWANYFPNEESSVPSVRSSFSIDALDIAPGSAERTTKHLYHYGSFGSYQSPSSWPEIINKSSCSSSSQRDMNNESGCSSTRASQGGSISAQTTGQVLDSDDIQCSTIVTAPPSAQPVSVQPVQPPVALKGIIQSLEEAAELEELNKLHEHDADCKDPQFTVQYGKAHSMYDKNIHRFEAVKHPQKVQCNDIHCSKASTSNQKTFDNVQEPQFFQFEELQKVTNNFSESLLPHSIAGLTFKGKLNDGQDIIVKENKLACLHSDKQFAARVRLLGGLHHQNIVRIIGACVKKRLFVYQYVCNLSLSWHLQTSNPVTMNWHVRYKVAIGIAKGLEFLHGDSQHAPVIHGSLRSKNILLTRDYIPKIADAGLKWQPDEIGAETCLIGATGYVAPEYLHSGTDTQETDIYAYGVILLELITGFKASPRPDQKVCLAEWARLLLKGGEMHKLKDMRIENSIVEEQLDTAIMIAMSCISKNPHERPQMTRVVEILESCLRSSGDNTHIVSRTPNHPGPSRDKFTPSLIYPRAKSSSKSHNLQRHVGYFLPIDCIDYAGCYRYAKPTNLHHMPHTLHQISQHQSPYPEHLTNLYQMPQQWQLPQPFLRPPPPSTPHVPQEKDSASHDEPESQPSSGKEQGKVVPHG